MAGDHDGALREYEDFVARYPQDRLAPLAALAAGNILLDAHEDYAEAILRFDRVIQDYDSSPWAVEAARRKGQTFQALEEWRPAGEAFGQALDLASKLGSAGAAESITDITASAADCYHRLGEHERVLDLCLRVLDGAPSPQAAATAMYRMGEAYEAVDRPGEAAACYAGLLGTYPCASRSLLSQVLQKRRLIDKYEEVDWAPYEAYEEVLQYRRRRDVAGALDRCREIETEPATAALLECAEYLTLRLEVALSANYGTAYRLLQDYRERYPSGQIAEDVDQTLDLWSEILDAEARVSENPDDPAMIATLGGLYIMAGSVEAARRTLERARDLDPESFVGSRYVLGYAYEYLGAVEPAIREFEIHLESYPTDNLIRARVGNLYMNLEAHDRAVSHFRWMVETAPHDPNAHGCLCEALFRAEQMREAVQECERAVELDPAHASAHFFLGRMYQKMGQDAEARSAFARFLDLNPTGDRADEARAAVERLQGE